MDLASSAPSPPLVQEPCDLDLLSLLGFNPCSIAWLRECELALERIHADTEERRVWRMHVQAALDHEGKLVKKGHRHAQDPGTLSGYTTQHGDEDLESRVVEATRLVDPQQYANENGALKADLEVGASTTNDEHPSEASHTTGARSPTPSAGYNA
ncbi:hypothetical protein FRC08_018131 [Ceratobasidium sp. 394]|nr:hypothetical protein FRC08_018131 [Ceratobasidium sp. 394]